MLIDENAKSRPVSVRPNAINPKSPYCRKEFKRICGTCAHFEGALRPDGGSDMAQCAYFDLPKNLNRDASACNRWSRKGPGVSQ